MIGLVVLVLIVGAALVIWHEALYLKEQLTTNEVSREMTISEASEEAVPYFNSEFSIDVTGCFLHAWVAADLYHSSHWYVIRMDPDTYAEILSAFQQRSDGCQCGHSDSGA